MIVGMTTTTPRPGVLGKLRKGGAKRTKTNNNGKSYEIFGEDLKHFRLDAEQDLVAALEAEYGPQPNRIVVCLPYAKASENFDAWMEEYNAAKLVHRCNGEYIHEWDKATGELTNTGRPCPYAAGKERTKSEPGCKQVGRLSVVIPTLITRASRFGLVTVETHSIHDIVRISQALAYYEMLSGGDLRGVSFILSRKPEMVTTQDGPRREKWLINIEPAQEWVARRLEDSRRMALAGPAVMAALPAPSFADDDDDDEMTTIEGEVVDTTTGEIQQVTPVNGYSRNGRAAKPEQVKHLVSLGMDASDAANLSQAEARDEIQRRQHQQAQATNGKAAEVADAKLELVRSRWQESARGARDLGIHVRPITKQMGYDEVVAAREELDALINDRVAELEAEVNATGSLPFDQIPALPAADAPISAWVELGKRHMQALAGTPIEGEAVAEPAAF
jgi:hypothetical protein